MSLVRAVAARDIVAVQDGQLTNEMIQGGAQVVNDIPHDKRPSGIIRAYFPMPDNYTLPLKLVIDGERLSFRYRSSPSLDATLQLGKVIFRTLELIADSDDAGTHDPA